MDWMFLQPCTTVVKLPIVKSNYRKLLSLLQSTKLHGQMRSCLSFCNGKARIFVFLCVHVSEMDEICFYSFICKQFSVKGICNPYIFFLFFFCRFLSIQKCFFTSQSGLHFLCRSQSRHLHNRTFWAQTGNRSYIMHDLIVKELINQSTEYSVTEYFVNSRKTQM